MVCSCPLSFLFGIVECDVASLCSTYAYGILNGDDEDTSVADFTGLCRFDDGLYGLFRILVAHHDGDKDALDGTGVVHDTTVDTGLSGFPDAPYIIIGEPLDVRFEQRVLHVLELGLSDNSFNLFHTLNNLRLDNLRFTICLSVCVNHRFFILET